MRGMGGDWEREVGSHQYCHHHHHISFNPVLIFWPLPRLLSTAIQVFGLFVDTLSPSQKKVEPLFHQFYPVIRRAVWAVVMREEQRRRGDGLWSSASSSSLSLVEVESEGWEVLYFGMTVVEKVCRILPLNSLIPQQSQSQQHLDSLPVFLHFSYQISLIYLLQRLLFK